MGLLDNLISYWKLDESSGTRYDATASANNLTDTNTVTQAAGKLNYAANFTSANSEYLIIDDNASISTGDIDYTWAFWFYPQSNSYFGLISKTDSSFDSEFEITYYSSAGRVLFSIYKSPSTQVSIYNTVEAVTEGAWNYVIAWHDSVANTINLQLNGGTVLSSSHSSGSNDSSHPLRMGMRYSGGPNYLDGRLDGVGFWKRVLSSDERAALYNAGVGLDYPFSDTFIPYSTIY